MFFICAYLNIFICVYNYIYNGQRKTSKKTKHINKRDEVWNKKLSNSLSMVRSDVWIIGVKGST